MLRHTWMDLVDGEVNLCVELNPQHAVLVIDVHVLREDLLPVFRMFILIRMVFSLRWFNNKELI